MNRHKMPEQDPNIRKNNFEEVALGYDEETAIEEAKRCLQCKNPQCRKGCPVHVNIPEFIKNIKERKFDTAISVIKESNSLPAVCGRVCPQENQCEKHCVLGIKNEPVAIGNLERFVADKDLEKAEEPQKIEFKENAPKIAIIGSGPAGLSASGDLVKLGYKVTIFEALHKAGGVLSYGIPEFRLPKDKIVKKEIENLEKLGVEIKLNSIAGKLFSIDELFEEGYSAVFIATGAGLPHFMNIKGENFNGVYSANEFLTRCNLMKAYKFPEYATPISVGKNVAVVGGGNVAMDSARSAKRLGAEKVFIIYRRSEEELPARKEEVKHAKEEGIEFLLLSNPVEIIGDDNGWVKQIKCIKMKLGEPDSSGRRRPIEIKDSEFTVDVDSIIMAIGQGPNPVLSSSSPNLQLNKRGNIIVNEETLETSIENVFAGGDIVTGAATVILAMGAGKKAAKAIDEKLKNQREK